MLRVISSCSLSTGAFPVAFPVFRNPPLSHYSEILEFYGDDDKRVNSLFGDLNLHLEREKRSIYLSPSAARVILILSARYTRFMRRGESKRGLHKQPFLPRFSHPPPPLLLSFSSSFLRLFLSQLFRPAAGVLLTVKGAHRFTRVRYYPLFTRDYEITSIPENRYLHRVVCLAPLYCLSSLCS